jgi:hypothetical protein
VEGHRFACALRVNKKRREGSFCLTEWIDSHASFQNRIDTKASDQRQNFEASLAQSARRPLTRMSGVVQGW